MRARRASLVVLAALTALPAPLAQAQQNVPSPSQSLPQTLPAPVTPTRIVLPRVEVGGAVPDQAKGLFFVLTGFEIEGEFAELAAQRRELEAPLVGKRISVAQVFEFAAQLQALYVRAGYPLVRVAIAPQEVGRAARVKTLVVDGFIERIEADALSPFVRTRVLDVLSSLIRKPHLVQGELERRLLIAGEAPGLELNAVFTAGKEVGGSILVLTGRYRPLSASAYIDNAMPAVFGGWQAVTTGSLNSVLGVGEQFSVTVAGLPDRDFGASFPTRRYLSGAISVPLGVDGFRIEANGTDGHTTPRVDPIFATEGLLRQGRIKLAFDAIKRRDVELTFSARFDATDEEVDSLLFAPAIPLSLDRLRVVRGSVDGVWRLRESGTVFGYGATFSRGLDAFGARTAADAEPLLPLSRAGADAVFTKLEGRAQINQSLPLDLFVMLAAYGQTSFNHPLLKSEQYDIVGAQMLSGYTSGSFAGDAAWVTRVELGRAFGWSEGFVASVITPYLFGATGERIYVQPSVLEQGSQHASNLGGGLRLNLQGSSEVPLAFSGFVEGSRQHSDDPRQRGFRLFAGAQLRH